MLAGLIVGTCEEWLQWFIPGRIGDMRDVFLNGAAIVSGLLFSIGVDPPAGMSSGARQGLLRRIGVAAAVAAVVFALFVSSVHLGVEVVDPEAGTFRSRYDAATLIELSRARTDAWRVNLTADAAAKPEPRGPVSERGTSARCRTQSSVVRR